MNDVMSAERRCRAPYSRLLFVIVHRVAGAISHREAVSGSPASVTPARGSRVEGTNSAR